MKYGPLTPQMIGFAVKEMVRRAILEIRGQRISFQVFDKVGYDGGEDLFTSADKAAQAIYVKLIREGFPGWGILGEEANLREPCTLEDHEIYVTVDPLDGTRAFKRGQSFGVGTMIAVVMDGEVICAYVGDVNTMDVFGYRPESDKVHHILEFGKAKNLMEVDRSKPLDRQVVLLRDEVRDHHPLLAALVTGARFGGAFKQPDMASGSIGTSMSRLWKGEVGAHVVKATYETPWDGTPVIGISQRLGMVWLRPNAAGTGLELYEPKLVTSVSRRDFDAIVVHHTKAAELMAAAERVGATL